MNKTEFILELRSQLAGLPPADIDDVVRDQVEHIDEAVASGRTESDAVAGLGNPKEFAASIKAYSKIQRAGSSTSAKERTSNMLGAVFAVVALAPFNIIFVLGPFMGLVGVLMAFWGISLALLAASLAAFLAFFTTVVFSSFEPLLMAWYFFLSVGLIGLSILLLFGMTKVTHLFGQLTLRYLKWNLNLLQGVVDRGRPAAAAASV